MGTWYQLGTLEAVQAPTITIFGSTWDLIKLAGVRVRAAESIGA